MKPISVRFRAFGPYVEEQRIPLDRLAEQGLFLICGETGAGKTTILDAICCALYGSCSGEIRGELEAMRCRQAGAGEPTEVEFVFESGGRRCCFGRKLTPRKSRKADGPVSYNEDYTCCAEEKDGTRVPLLDNAKKKSMNAKAEELIGLNLDQFRQVIILPQGRFETLLTSRSEEKENILSSLFRTGRWKTAVDRMNDEVNARRNGTERETQAIAEALKVLQVNTVEELPEAVRQAAEEAGAKAEEERKAGEERARAQALLGLKKEFQELDRRTGRLAEARQAAADDPRLRARLEMARRAEKARQPFEAWTNAAESLKRAEKQREETEKSLKEAEQALARAEADKAACEALEGEQQKRKEERQRLTTLGDRYRNIARLEKEAAAAKAALAKAGQAEETARKALERETEAQRVSTEGWNAASEEYLRVSGAYRAAMAGHMAAELEEGKPCPVCGSRSHPAPASLPEGAPESRDVEAAEERLKAARKAFDSRTETLRKAREAHQEADGALAAARSAFDQADGALKQELDGREPGLDSLEALEARSRMLEDAIRAYEEKKEKLSALAREAVAGRDTLKGTAEERRSRLEDARREFGEREEAWRKALAETGLGTETQYSAAVMPVEGQEKLIRTLTDHEAALKAAAGAVAEQQAALEGKNRPDFGTVDRICAEADRNYTEAVRARTLASQRMEQLKKESERLSAQADALARRRAALESDSAFVRALRGSMGIGIQRYVLGVRLSQVTAEANRLLSGIYGGRYRLHRSNESYGSAHKSGLELEVSDSLSGQRRSVCTLSGGEKFLVALSLAIGLRTVVQNEQRGADLDAMFIDEGFGSLDQGTLGDALEVLQAVRRGRGMVGIISHVSLLEETIPTKIEIRKTPGGSRTELCIG